AGLLDLSWEVLCPNCRSTRGPIARRLAEVESGAHCEACQIHYNAEFDKSVELKFTVNPGIKVCEKQIFCLAGPVTKPHIIAQIIIPLRSSTNLMLPSERRGLRFRSQQVAGVIQDEAARNISRLVLKKEGFVIENGSTESVKLENPNDYP